MDFPSWIGHTKTPATNGNIFFVAKEVSLDGVLAFECRVLCHVDWRPQWTWEGEVSDMPHWITPWHSPSYPDVNHQKISVGCQKVLNVFQSVNLSTHFGAGNLNSSESEVKMWRTYEWSSANEAAWKINTKWLLMHQSGRWTQNGCCYSAVN